jgi:hypothetical protein
MVARDDMVTVLRNVTTARAECAFLGIFPMQELIRRKQLSDQLREMLLSIYDMCS